MQEAAAFQMPLQLRQLLVDICLFCNPSDALHLFEINLNHLMEDYIRSGHEANVAKNLTLKWIQDKLRLHNQTMEDLSLPVPDFHLINQLVEAQMKENNENSQREKRLMGEMMLAQLNDGQRAAFDQVMTAVNDVNNSHPRQYFLDGPGGTGKTFLYNTLFTVLQGQGRQVIAVASTGIASTLLLDGTTYHSQFKIYPPITETTRSKIEEASYNAQLIRNASLIISDEATMKTNHALDAINHLFQTVMKNRVDPYGGKVLLLGGDFRQCLLVVRHGNRVKIIEANITNNATWPLFRQLRLVQNMRTVDGSQDFADWLIQLGNGSLAQTPWLNDPDLIEIPQDLLNIRTNLIEHVFGDPSDLLNEGVREQVCNRAILCPKNEDCLRINNKIIGEMPGALKVCKSIDTIDSEDPEEISNYPPEILNTFNVSGLPPHQLKLKIGAIVILLKNIDSRQGLCNGTRLIIKALSGNLIVAEIAAGKQKGHHVFLPRMSMSPTDSDLPFKLKRLQFPVLVAFAMTINKSQGQTFERVGIYLP
ncbi:ATP-dependent DNA helicase PIF1-like [Daphnia magna]|uniref:ATP-dependent DNA helicase PIF1-like n=1 Tax=Daphnia magna TaxID=35525 RepID=UPI001E1BD868|nr:ATP-dependent DNA helicase PIF1-like [Daphnia magna]